MKLLEIIVNNLEELNWILPSQGHLQVASFQYLLGDTGPGGLYPTHSLARRGFGDQGLFALSLGLPIVSNILLKVPWSIPAILF